MDPIARMVEIVFLLLLLLLAEEKALTQTMLVRELAAVAAAVVLFKVVIPMLEQAAQATRQAHRHHRETLAVMPILILRPTQAQAAVVQVLQAQMELQVQTPPETVVLVLLQVFQEHR